jgi:hypothetical protein
LSSRRSRPANVLLAADGSRVIDFGISRARDSASLTRAGTLLGSPGYLSPEQAGGVAVGPPGDVFSLGAVLTFAATGAGPFGRAPTSELVQRAAHQVPDLSAVPASLRPLLASCLAKDPSDRPTPAELLAELSAETGPQTGGWLPAPIAEALARYTLTDPADRALPTEDPAPQAVGIDDGTTAVPARKRPPRRWPVAAAAAAAVAAVAVPGTLLLTKTPEAVGSRLPAPRVTVTVWVTRGGTRTPVQLVQQVANTVGATAFGCADYGSLGSGSGGRAVQYTFINDSQADIEVWSLTSGGSGQLDADVAPGGIDSPGVTTEQYAMVATSTGECMTIIKFTGNGHLTVSS